MKIIGVIFGLLCIISVMILIGGAKLFGFPSLSFLGLVIICPFLIALGNFKAKDILNSFRDGLSQEVMYDEERLILSYVILKSLFLFTIIFGIIGTLIEFIILLAHMDEPKDIPPALGISLLPPLYALILSVLVYAPLSKKLEISSIDLDNCQKNIGS
jgi:magnesium-transporting ATPase (P-type)